MTNCTREAVIDAFGIISAEAEAEGYPKMKALGITMRNKLEPGRN